MPALLARFADMAIPGPAFAAIVRCMEASGYRWEEKANKLRENHATGGATKPYVADTEGRRAFTTSDIFLFLFQLPCVIVVPQMCSETAPMLSK